MISDRTLDGLNAALNLRMANQSVISSNIANADTPGYKAQKLEFEDELRGALLKDQMIPLETENKDHLSQKEPSEIMATLYDNPNGVVQLDGNSVDRNSEQVALAENQIKYNTDTEMMRRKLDLLKYSISEGGSR